MYPNSIYMGLKVLPIWVHWAQSIYYLGTWTLRVIEHYTAKKSYTPNPTTTMVKGKDVHLRA